MDRKKFIKDGLIGAGALIIGSSVLKSCKKDNVIISPDACVTSPVETAGPFPIKSPADLINSNVVGDRLGVPLIINFTIQDSKNGCAPLSGVYVDIWQCDSKGNYSEYSGQLDGDFTGKHFLRGRQLTDANGKVSFVSVYPGWYPNRAPHIHIEVKDSSNNSLLITQTAFPESVSKIVYASSQYRGVFDTPNANDGVFGSDLNRSMVDNISGNVTDGYVINDILKI
jgi:protocatechuate 3,4-dioxygenase beta subunit